MTHPQSGSRIKLRWSPRCFVCQHIELSESTPQPFEANTRVENTFLAALATIIEALRTGAEWTDLPNVLCEKHAAQLSTILAASEEIMLEEHN